MYIYKYDLQMHCCITVMVSLIESLPTPPMVAQSLCPFGHWRMGRLALAYVEMEPGPKTYARMPASEASPAKRSEPVWTAIHIRHVTIHNLHMILFEICT